MEFTELDEVRVRGRIGTVEKVIYEMVDGKETDNVYASDNCNVVIYNNDII